MMSKCLNDVHFHRCWRWRVAGAISNSISVSLSTTDILNFLAISFKVFYTTYTMRNEQSSPHSYANTLRYYYYNNHHHISHIISVFKTSWIACVWETLERCNVLSSRHTKKRIQQKLSLYIPTPPFTYISLVEWNVRCKNPFIFHLKYQLARTAPILFFQ